MPNDPLDAVKIGDWFWVRYDDEDNESSDRPINHDGWHEHLMCVYEIGSNYLGLKVYSNRYELDDRVHFNEFLARCRPETKWRDVLNKRMENAQKAIRDKTAQLIREGQKLCLLPDKSSQNDDQPKTMLPARVSVDPNQHKQALVKLQNRLPDISKEIDDLGKDFAVAARNLALPDLVTLGSVKKALGIVEDRIFTIELYCGILEEVQQIAKGEPAPINTPITIRQQMLYMDEETLFDYDSGGMDFNKINDFDEWVVKQENLNRILPESRGIVAFRVRRNQKDYPQAKSIAEEFIHLSWANANKQTYLLIRNGENVYRIASEVDFTPRLIPKIGEIGEDQFKKIDRRWVWGDDNRPGHNEEKVTLITPDSVNFDDHVEMVSQLLKHYNRIVILIQGLLDRSTVFHPHPPIRLTSQDDMDKWIVLLRDEERALPNNTVTWDEYRKQVNTTIAKGKWVYVDPDYDERYKDGDNPNYNRNRHQIPPKRGWSANRMPRVIQVQTKKRDGSAIYVSWPKGKNSKYRKTWIKSEDRPGYGHYKHDDSTDALCHEWIPVDRVFNVSDYNLGDYKMFLCDRTLQGQYLKWATYLLTAENLARNRANGNPIEK